ncbi:peptidase C39-like protein [Branchiibius hedensis]|uniref:Peptidase_C39 like family protein n=1 Tax=Branchiibius hedensis TaxID=672460 RepID=A0A2Y8ZN47_9MICO|nr:C39 family peptidase [Branchiibius hedensis]PWJ24924.1 peptidase C39-like protein [Branchiibius hedensis]SSA33740.1 Peptidase_C39 like family protein [Branchiibius hedensis]
MQTQLTRRTLITGIAGVAGATALGGLAAPEALAANWKVLNHEYQAQQAGYWCGPAATRIALTCRGIYVAQSTLASQLGTTVNGTDSITQVTAVLGSYVGWFETKQMPNDPPTQAQKDLLWQDITFNIDRGYPLVANIVAPPGNQPPGYPSDQTIYHYFTIIGYNPDLKQAYIADPANFSGNNHYWLSFEQLASLIPPKGYSA